MKWRILELLCLLSKLQILSGMMDLQVPIPIQ